VNIKLFNTLGRKVQDFIPIEEGKAGMYACGPTVYNFAHIGNLRTYVFEDLLRRMFEYFGYSVTHVMNITDVGHLTDDADEGEDKMIVGARQRKMTVWEIADFFSNAFFTDLKKLNIEQPNVTCKATEHIQDMIDLISRLEKNGNTYSAGGNIYFDISTFKDYGRLALLDNQELLAGARTGIDENKKHPHDFALWFTRSKFEHQAMQWESPWGRGYPGWHVECSAMSMKYLGEHFDIHLGGIDHIPVHHTNEIAQSEAATGKPWVNYWIHGEFLIMEKGKMAKSAGNFLTLKSLEDSGYDPLDFRYLCLGGHYRSQLQFSEEALSGARSARLNCVDRLKEVVSRAETDEKKPLSEKGRGYRASFEEHIARDLNIPRALADVWGILKEPDISYSEKADLILSMDTVLGLKLKESVQTSGSISQEQMKLIKEREEARKNKDFKRADEIRELLHKGGIEIKDTPEGTRWKITK